MKRVVYDWALFAFGTCTQVHVAGPCGAHVEHHPLVHAHRRPGARDLARHEGERAWQRVEGAQAVGLGACEAQCAPDGRSCWLSCHAEAWRCWGAMRSGLLLYLLCVLCCTVLCRVLGTLCRRS